MKSFYKPPEITVEELKKADVLCASDEIRLDNHTVDNVWDALSSLSFIEESL